MCVMSTRAMSVTPVKRRLLLWLQGVVGNPVVELCGKSKQFLLYRLITN